MNLKNFEKEIDPIIIDRGYEYHKHGCVENLFRISDGKWHATVLGTDNYQVEIELSGQEIIGWSCDCPYDWGPVCKHIVAVLCEIQAVVSEGKESEFSVTEKKSNYQPPSKQRQLTEIFEKISKEELVKYIEEKAVDDNQFFNDFVAHFSDKLHHQSRTYYQELIRNIFRAHADRYGFISYNATFATWRPIDSLAAKAEQLFEDGQYEDSLAICQALIEEIPDIVQQMDDSAGMTGDTMDIAFNNLAKIVHHFGSSKLKNDLFHYCLEEFPKEKYSNFGWHEKFFDLFPILISCAEHEQKYLALLDHQIEKEEQREHGFGYGLETVLMKKLAFLKQKGKTKETQKLLEKYLHLFRIREMVVNEAIEKHNYDRAKALIEEGIEISQRSRYPGLVMSWKDKLLTIAKLEDNIADVRTYAEDLFINGHHDFQYYDILKKTYEKDEWKEIIEDLIQKIILDKKGRGTESNIIADIFVKEKYFDRLLIFLQGQQENLHLIENYQQHLAKEYPEEVLQLYGHAIQKYAQQTGRNIYLQLVRILQKMEKIKGGAAVVKRLVTYFKEHYPNRPAMLEVLGRHYK